MSKTFHAEILTPVGKLFEGEVLGVRVPGTEGSFEMRLDHAPIVSMLEIGHVRVKGPENETSIAVSGGFVEMVNNRLTLLAEAAERAEDIDVERAKKAYQSAVKHLKDKTIPREEAEKALARAENRLKLSGEPLSEIDID
ncbi:MAG: ATP synthase F1 subunit epsilon [Balneolaceae bacterium]